MRDGARGMTSLRRSPCPNLRQSSGLSPFAQPADAFRASPHRDTHALYAAMEGRGMRGIVVSGAPALFLLASSLVASARADFIPPCPVPDGVIATSLENAPPPLLRALKERIGELVPPGGRFDSTDVVRVGKNRRLILIWNAGKRWIVATEHGGIGYNDPIFAYDLGQDDQNAILTGGRIAFPGTVCRTANDLLSAPPADPDLECHPELGCRNWGRRGRP